MAYLTLDRAVECLDGIADETFQVGRSLTDDAVALAVLQFLLVELMTEIVGAERDIESGVDCATVNILDKLTQDFSLNFPFLVTQFVSFRNFLPAVV